MGLSGPHINYASPTLYIAMYTVYYYSSQNAKHYSCDSSGEVHSLELVSHSEQCLGRPHLMCVKLVS